MNSFFALEPAFRGRLYGSGKDGEIRAIIFLNCAMPILKQEMKN